MLLRRARSTIWVLALVATALVSGCASSGRFTTAPFASTRDSQVGIASYYGAEFHGRATASGQTYRKNRLTAAHRTLPFGTRVRVTNLDNGRAVVVKINDRGPHRRGRIIDLSARAARELDFIRDGVARVRLDLVD